MPELIKKKGGVEFRKDSTPPMRNATGGMRFYRIALK